MLQRARNTKIAWPAPSFLLKRPLMCAAFALLAGTALSTRVPYGLWIWAASLLCLAMGALLLRAGRRGFVLILCALALLGAARGAMELHAPPLPDTGRWTVEGTLNGSVRRNEKAIMFTLGDVRVTPVGTDETIPIQSNLYVYYPTQEASDLSHGQRIRVQGTSYLPDGARNPGGFDQRMWLAQSGTHARLYATSVPRVLAQAGFSIRGFALSVSESLARRMDALFGDAAPVVRAMLLGDQTDIADDWYAWLRDSGIVHILSVSGLHVALWYMLLEKLLRPLPISPRVRWGMLAFLLCAYTLITGFSVSVLRACIMLLAVQGGQVARRKVDPLTSLAVAAAGILLFRPLDLFGAGFQLSFCAVLGIVLLNVPLKRMLRVKRQALADSFSVTVSAQIGVLPISAYWFGKVSVISLLINLAAIPLSGLLIPVSALGVALNALWEPLGWVFVESSKGLVALLLLIAKLGAAVPFATLRIGAFAWYALAAYFLCMLLCSTAVVWRWRTRIACIGALCLAVGTTGYLTAYHGVLYVQLDVGQALSGVLHTGGKTYVYDCGNENSDLTEYLLYTGSSVEGLFLSHPHADHTGGLTELVESGVPVKTVYVPIEATRYGADTLYTSQLSMLAARGIPVIELTAGDVLDLNGLPATVISPDQNPPPGKDPNGLSTVLRIAIGEHTLLLCGDVNDVNSANIDCDVLQVAHHGSKNASGEAFLQSATPDIALISVGRNTYGHPHPDTMARLTNTGADIYTTQENGALTLYFDQDTIRVEAYCR